MACGGTLCAVIRGPLGRMNHIVRKQILLKLCQMFRRACKGLSKGCDENKYHAEGKALNSYCIKLLASNITIIQKGSTRPFFLTELIEKCSFCPLQIQNERGTYLKYLDAHKMGVKVSKSQLTTLNGQCALSPEEEEELLFKVIGLSNNSCLMRIILFLEPRMNVK